MTHGPRAFDGLPRFFSSALGQQRARGPLAARDRRRGPVRPCEPRSLLHRRLDLPDRSGRRGRAEDRAGRENLAADRGRGRRSGPAARRGQLAMRPDGGRCARHRPQQIPRQHRFLRQGGCHRSGAARGRARRPQRAAAAARAVVPGGRVHERAGDARRHGRQQLLRFALDPLRQHGAQRARHRRAARRRQRAPLGRGAGRCFAAFGRRALCRACEEGARHRGAGSRRNRGALAEGAAARAGLQPGFRETSRRMELRAAPGRLRRHARVFQADPSEALAPAPVQDPGRVPFPVLPPIDGSAATHSQTVTDGGRARGSDDDRPGARQPGVPRDRREIRPRRSRRDPAGRVRRRRSRWACRQARAARRTHGRPRPSGQRDPDHRRRTPAGRVGGEKGRPQHHDVDERRRQARLLHRGLRGPSGKPRRVHRFADAGLPQTRHRRHLVRARLGGNAARAADTRHEERRREENAGDRGRSLRPGEKIQGRRLFGGARRRPGALGVDSADHR